MATTTAVILAILIFSFLIFIHELGHFVAAKLSGVQVNEFSMFMGPALLKKKWGETQYTLRLIPLGGYCAMEGEDGDSENPRAFGNAKWWKRLIILVAGAAMNFLSGLVLLGIFYGPWPQFVVPQVEAVEPESCMAGYLEPGDRLYKLDGEKIYDTSDFELLLTLNPRDTHELVVKRQGEKVTYSNLVIEKREITEENGKQALRYGFNYSIRKASVPALLDQVWRTAANTVRMVRLSLKMLFTGQAGIKDLGGPVMIVDMMAQTANSSEDSYQALMSLVYFGAFLGINLAVMNLLPIPALDGGRVVCLIITETIQAFTHKKVDPKYEGYINAGGMILLLGLMGIIMFKDIFVLFTR